MTAKRLVIIRIDDLAQVLQQYLPPEDLPPGAKPVALLTSPRQNGKIAVQFTSEGWNGDLGEQLVDAELKRIFSVS